MIEKTLIIIMHIICRRAVKLCIYKNYIVTILMRSKRRPGICGTAARVCLPWKQRGGARYTRLYGV